MKIEYIHKATGVKVSLEQLKENKSKFFSFSKINIGMDESKHYEYGAMAIPLSDDFEISCTTDNELTVDELHEILCSLNTYTNTSYELYSKVKKMFCEKRFDKKSR